MSKSPEDAIKSMIANMPEKTGKSLTQWLKLAANSKLQKHGQIVSHLKLEYGLTHGYANLVVHEHLKSDQPINLVDAQYSGGKTDLRPIHDALVSEVEKFGVDVEISPKKTCVSLRRNKQFAVITPATKTRIDLGINLKGHDGTSRLLPLKNAMCTHKVQITELNQIDQELIKWLTEAYKNA
ncbi:DUF4287 domain-containing protein [Oceanicaulis sp. AH-315-P02]|nr:DUF4287 domain-containing protein [Robiginitomaculum sp.]MBN4047812.1 DUF4287 domain-containing protein [Oceanicaulis sp. AH-315-P02]